MLECALEHVGDDLHVAVAVSGEALARRDAIVVDHAQRAEPHVRGIVILAERERVSAVEPVDLRAAARGGGSDDDAHAKSEPPSTFTSAPVM